MHLQKLAQTQSSVRPKPLFWFRSNTETTPKLADTFLRYRNRYQKHIIIEVEKNENFFIFHFEKKTPLQFQKKEISAPIPKFDIKTTWTRF